MKHIICNPLAFFIFFSSASFGQTYQDYLNQGKAEKDPLKQASYFTQALSVSKTDSAFYYRALAKLDQDQYEEAIADYDQAIRLNPYFKWAYADRGMARRLLKKHEEAIVDLDFAITLDKANDFAYGQRGLTKYQLGKYADAIFDYNKAIEINPDYSQYYLWRGWAYSELDKRPEALADFSQAIKLKPGDYRVYYFIGVEKIYLSRYQDAIPDFDQAIKLSPKYASAYNGRGVANKNLGRYDAAIADFDQAIKLNPGFKLAIQNKINAIKFRNASAANQYNAEPLGFKLGITSLAVVKQTDGEMREDGYSKWTDGKKFTSKGTVHNIEGAQSIVYIFDKEDLLDVVIINMHKDYFYKVNSYLKSKYKLLSANVPPVGDKHTKYTQGNSIIQLDAPHLSFDMEVIYKTKSFDTALQNGLKSESIKKTTEQKNKF